MKKIGILLLLSFLCLGSRASFANQQFHAAAPVIQADTVTDTIKVHDLRCGQCESRVHRAMKKVAGIVDGYADVETQTVVVTYLPAVTTRAKIEDMIVNTGYGVGKRNGDPASRKALPSCCK